MRFIIGLFAAVVIFTVQPVLAETYTERKEREALEAEAPICQTQQTMWSLPSYVDGCFFDKVLWKN